MKGRNLFKDVRVRNAFYRAIDMNAIESRILRGAGRPLGMMIAATPAARASVQPRLASENP